MVIGQRNVEQEQQPMTAKKADAPQGSMNQKFRDNKSIDAGCGVEWVDVIELKVRQAHQLPIDDICHIEHNIH